VNLSVWRFVVIAFEKQWAGGRAGKIVCILGQQKKSYTTTFRQQQRLSRCCHSFHFFSFEIPLLLANSLR
jgi:hypothetical protein